ncbi:MAG: methylenetetrahydrofolate--tRNA-(uracil(54)-C(5))-methyltransferase (FADH(2)-oxidizing) TrmFO, partial [Clostridia bacterium]
ETMIGSLQHYISNGTVSDFQPMNANYGIVEPLETHVKTKKLKYEIMAQRSIDKMKEIIRFNGI